LPSTPRQTSRLDPTYADAFRNRGFAKMHKNLVDEAIDDFSGAIVLTARDAASGAEQSGLPSPMDSWQEQTFDQGTTRYVSRIRKAGSR